MCIGFELTCVDAYGYIPNAATQSESALQSIQQGIALVPATAFALAFILMLFYPLTDKRHAELVKEIQDRRASGKTNTASTKSNTVDSGRQVAADIV